MASVVHVPTKTHRPAWQAKPLARQSVSAAHSGGGTHSPDSHTCPIGQGCAGQRTMSWQKPRLHSLPLGQSLSRAQSTGGKGTQAPSRQLARGDGGSTGGQSLSTLQPSGTMQLRAMHTMPGKGQSASLPQAKGGKQRVPMQRQALEHSESELHVLGSQ